MNSIKKPSDEQIEDEVNQGERCFGCHHYFTDDDDYYHFKGLLYRCHECYNKIMTKIDSGQVCFLCNREFGPKEPSITKENGKCVCIECNDVANFMEDRPERKKKPVKEKEIKPATTTVLSWRCNTCDETVIGKICSTCGKIHPLYIRRSKGKKKKKKKKK